MTSLSMRLVVNCVRGWTWLYTWRMPSAFVRLDAREMSRTCGSVSATPLETTASDPPLSSSFVS